MDVTITVTLSRKDAERLLRVHRHGATEYQEHHDKFPFGDKANRLKEWYKTEADYHGRVAGALDNALESPNAERHVEGVSVAA